MSVHNFSTNVVLSLLAISFLLPQYFSSILQAHLVSPTLSLLPQNTSLIFYWKSLIAREMPGITLTSSYSRQGGGLSQEGPIATYVPRHMSEGFATRSPSVPAWRTVTRRKQPGCSSTRSLTAAYSTDTRSPAGEILPFSSWFSCLSWIWPPPQGHSSVPFVLHWLVLASLHFSNDCSELLNKRLLFILLVLAAPPEMYCLHKAMVLKLILPVFHPA